MDARKHLNTTASFLILFTLAVALIPVEFIQQNKLDVEDKRELITE